MNSSKAAELPISTDFILPTTCHPMHYVLALQSMTAFGAPMATLTIRNLDEQVKALLRVEAARHGRSMEEEVRVILQNALAGKANVTGFGSRVHQRFASLEDEGLTIPDRTERPRAAEFPE